MWHLCTKHQREENTIMSFASPQRLFGINYLSFARKLGFKGNSTGISTEIGLISEMPSALGFQVILTSSGIFLCSFSL